MAEIVKRLFTFGCSLTRYHYPTWADILGKTWEYHENWGEPGAGNTFIFNSIIECDVRNDLGPDDTVLILWSAHGRHDYYQFDRWLHCDNAWSDSRGHNTFNCPAGYEINSYALMHAAHQYLSGKNISYRSLRWQLWDIDTEVAEIYKNVLSRVEYFRFSENDKLYDPWEDGDSILRSEIERLYQRLAGPDWPSLESILDKTAVPKNEDLQREIDDFHDYLEIERRVHRDRLKKMKKLDRHPLPTQYLDAVKKLFPQIDISADISSWVIEIEKKILSNQPFEFSPAVPKKRF